MTKTYAWAVVSKFLSFSFFLYCFAFRASDFGFPRPTGADGIMTETTPDPVHGAKHLLLPLFLSPTFREKQ